MIRIIRKKNQTKFQVVPNKPEALFGTQYGSLFRDIDLLIGFSSNPAHHLLANDDLQLGIDKERREKIFRFVQNFSLIFIEISVSKRKFSIYEKIQFVWKIFVCFVLFRNNQFFRKLKISFFYLQNTDKKSL